jgi:hypothetical protein
MSEYPHDLPFLMGIPLDEDGEPDFEPVAIAILMDMEKAPEGRKIVLRGRVEEDFGWFQARYESGATMTVQKECLGTKFGASLFLALQAHAPKRVQAEP